MKKALSTLVAAGLVATLLVNTAHAGKQHDSDFNPLWIPVAILSTVVAVAAITQPPPVYEHREQRESKKIIIVDEPRHHQAGRYHESRDTMYHDRCDRENAAPRHWKHR